MRWKGFITIGSLLVIALMATGYVILSSYDYNKLKPQVAQIVKEVTGRELNLGGEIDFVIGFSPTLTVSDVNFANASWGSQPQMLKIKQLQVQVAILPLLFKNLELKHIVFMGGDVFLETDKSGHGNWDFNTEESSAGIIGTFKLHNIAIDKIRLEKLHITFRDGGREQEKQLTLASFEVTRQGAVDSLTLKLKADYNEQQLTLAGKVGLIQLLLAHDRFPLELTGKVSNATIKIDGTINDVFSLQGIDLQASVAGTNLAKIGSIIGEKLPATDEFSVVGRLTGSARVLTISEASGSAKRDSLKLTLTGKIEDLINFSGLDLQVNGSGLNLAEFGAIIEEKLPSTDEFSVEGQLTGSVKALSLYSAQGNATRGNLHIALSGEINDLIAFSGLDLQLKGSGKNLTEIGAIIGEKLPVTDEFAIQGRLMGSSKVLSLKEARASANKDNLKLSLNGGITDLMAFSGVDLKVNGSGTNLAEISAIINHKLPVTGVFKFQGRLTGSEKELSLQDVQGNVNRGNLNLAVTGQIKNLSVLSGMDLRLKGSGNELAEIGTLVGSNLSRIGPFDIRGHLVGSTKLLLLNELSAIVDKSDFKGMAKIELNKRPKITAQLESSVIDLTPFMSMAEKDKQELGEEKKRAGRLFPDNPLPFDVLQKVDADFDVTARNIHMKDAQFEFGHLNLTLADNNLSIDKFEATYKETKITGNLHIEAGSPPSVAINFLVQNFNLGEFLQETGKDDKVRGIVDIAAQGKSSGDSVSSLMAHLNGSFGVVMGPGYLTKYLDLLSMDLTDKVIPFWGRHKKADEINCAVFESEIKNGDAISKAFVNTQVGILSIKGDINLGNEQVNFLLNPQPKDFSLVNLSTKMRVTGTLMDPQVSPDALSLTKRAAKEVAGFLALGPFGLLAPFVHLGADEKHPCDIKNIGQLKRKISTNE